MDAEARPARDVAEVDALGRCFSDDGNVVRLAYRLAVATVR